MAEIVNLRLAKKAQARKEKAAKAAENRALHGRTKGQKQAENLDQDRARRHLEGHKAGSNPSKDETPKSS